MTIDKVVGMVAVRNSLMAAVRAMCMFRVVSFAIMPFGAIGRVLRADLNLMLIYMTIMGVMQVAVVKEVDVAVMPDRGVPALAVVLVRVLSSATPSNTCVDTPISRRWIPGRLKVKLPGDLLVSDEERTDSSADSR